METTKDIPIIETRPNPWEVNNGSCSHCPYHKVGPDYPGGICECPYDCDDCPDSPESWARENY